MSPCETKRWGNNEKVTEKDNKDERLQRNGAEKIKEIEEKRARETGFPSKYKQTADCTFYF